MTPAARKATAVPNPPPPACGYPVGDGTCGRPATAQLPIGYASNSEPIPLCDGHGARFLGSTASLP